MSVIDELITNRSSTDVSALVALNKKISNGTATEEEMAEYALARHKGAYNYTDLNRVTKAMEYLDERLKQYGYHSRYDPIVIPRASVRVHAPSGSVVTMSKGSKVLAAEETSIDDEMSEWYFTPPEKGEWTVTATIDEKNEVSVVTISDAIGYDVKLGLAVPRLPEEYQEVTYLKSTGTQYSVTNYYPNQNTVVKMDLRIDAVTYSSTWAQIFGVEGISPTNFAIWGNNGNFNFYCGSESGKTKAFTIGQTYNIEFGSGSVVVDGVTVGSFSTMKSTATMPLAIGAINNYLTKYPIASQTFFPVEIVENGVTVCHYIPCYIKSTGEAGFYDLVSGAFFGNDGTGAFAVGPDVSYEDTMLWLYRGGDECEDITGGWGTDGWTSTESGWSIGASVTKNADNMYTKAPGNQRYCVGAMTTPVDLTGYSKLCMDVQTGSATWSLELLVTGSKDYNGANGFLYEDKSAATRTVVTADISSINQEAYIAFASGGNNASRWAYIYNIWLE